MIKFSNYYKFTILFILIYISFLRSPYIFLNGRFFSLDTKYYVYALSQSFLDTLLFIEISTGYINLISNLSSLIAANFFTLKFAPYCPVYISFFVLIVIFSIILFKDSFLFQKDFQKILGAFIFLITPPFVFEVWLNVINLQVYLGLLTFILLFVKFNNKYDIFIYPPIIFISGLSGIYSCLTFPFFLIRYLKNRNLINLINFISIFLPTLIQLLITFYSKTADLLHPGPLSFTFSFFEIVSYTYNSIIQTFLGGSFPNFIMSLFSINIDSVLSNKNHLIFTVIFSILILIIIFIIFFKLFLKVLTKLDQDNIITLTLIVFFIEVSIFVIIGGLNDSIQGRYSVIPGATLLLLTLHLVKQYKQNFFSKFLFLILCVAFITGIYDFRYKKYIHYFDCINCSDWKIEVDKYEKDNNYKLKSWPYN